MSDQTALEAWAASGAMALTGRPDGPPGISPGRPALLVRRSLEVLSSATAERTGILPDLPGVELLGERAAIAGLARNGPWSCGGSFRAVRTLDGWLGISLARPSDRDLVPALIESEHVPEPWSAVADWAHVRSTTETLERARLLDLACSSVPAAPEPARPGVSTRRGGRREVRRERPLVVDLTSLWAGPLCAHLLGLTGADVVKVESAHRLDGARRDAAGFFDLLHAGHRSVTVDFADQDALAALHRLITSSDLVLEASRPRALRRLGILAEEVVEAGTSWLSITAHGRGSDLVGFGDDVAVGAGLHLVDRDEVLPSGDALADPLTGVVAAAEAAKAFLGEHAVLVDVSMHHVAREAAQGGVEPHELRQVHGEWWLDTGSGNWPVLPARCRTPSEAAARPGTHNCEVLR